MVYRLTFIGDHEPEDIVLKVFRIVALASGSVNAFLNLVAAFQKLYVAMDSCQDKRERAHLVNDNKNNV
jgi:hypothetical protein